MARTGMQAEAKNEDRQTQLARVEQGTYGEYLRANAPIARGEKIFYLDGAIQTSASKHSIQLETRRHVVTENSIWRFTNHACVPNMRIDTEQRAMVAVRDIAEGEELNFNYNTSEWAISSSFACGCGLPECMGEVRGFKFVPEKSREALRPYLTPYLQKRWADGKTKSGSKRQTVRDLKPEVHVLISYEDEDGTLVSPEYDTPKFRAELDQWFGPLGLKWVWNAVTFENLAEVIASLKARQKKTPIVVLNLCDGSEVDGYPGKSVIRALAEAELPYSGASAEFYHKSTSKLISKAMFEASGVSTPPRMLIENVTRDVDRAIEEIGTPLIVKPDVSAGSYGIQIDSVCHDRDAAIRKINALRRDKYIKKGKIFVEAFISGREFTVFVVEDDNAPLGLRVLTPCERYFNQRLPEDERFCSYERHWDMPEEHSVLPEGEKYCVHMPVSGPLREELEPLVRQAVRAVSGSGYARCDVRQDGRTGKLYVLEVNSQCDLTTDPTSEIGSILEFSGLPMSSLVEMILNHALLR